MTKIEWTEQTWNPMVGCSKISAGCQNCYAINQAYRNDAMGQKLDNPGRLAYYDGLTEKRGNRVEWTGVVRFVPEALEIPLKRKKPTVWFVNSMSDLFYESVSFENLCEIFDVMGSTPHHIYQILTKRPDRMAELVPLIYRELAAREGLELSDDFEPPSHIWLGVTVENQKAADELIPLLLQTPAAVRFLSCEPLLGGLNLGRIRTLEAFSEDGPGTINALTGEMFDADRSIGHTDNIDWVIVGGESGPKARPCDIDWVRSIIGQCDAMAIPCFVKQLGSKPVFSEHDYPDCQEPWLVTGKGSNMDEWPEDIRVRQMPRGQHEIQP